jgi:NAD(P)-dependent dehydrogenase (short-subunit alcohol dehydrogenase family)
MKNLILITGASSGVGLSLARHLSSRFHVLAVARRIEKLEQEFKGNGNVSSYRIDLSEEREAEDVIDRILKDRGFIPYLVNNAGVNIKASIPDLKPEDLRKSLQVNALSPAMILRKLLPEMKAKKFGRIINVTSGAPLNCFPEYGAYSASKATLNALTVTAAKECAELNIKINLMSPGPVRTEMAPDAPMDPSVCHPTADYLLGLGEDGPTGRFFWLGYEIPLFPNLEGIHWLEGRAAERFKKVF